MDYLKGYFSPINTFNSGHSYCDTLDNRSHLGGDTVVPIAENAFSTQGKGRGGKTHLQQTQHTCIKENFRIFGSRREGRRSTEASKRKEPKARAGLIFGKSGHCRSWSSDMMDS